MYYLKCFVIQSDSLRIFVPKLDYGKIYYSFFPFRNFYFTDCARRTLPYSGNLKKCTLIYGHERCNISEGIYVQNVLFSFT